MMNHTPLTAAVAAFSDHKEAELAIRSLCRGGFEMPRLSVVAAEPIADEHVIGYYHFGDTMKAWGSNAKFWHAVGGLFFGAAFFSIPRIGAVLVAGPLIGAMFEALEAGSVPQESNLLATGLTALGLPNEAVHHYEREIGAGHTLVVAHGTKQATDSAKNILLHSGFPAPKLYQPPRGGAIDSHVMLNDAPWMLEQATG